MNDKDFAVKIVRKKDVEKKLTFKTYSEICKLEIKNLFKVKHKPNIVQIVDYGFD